ncbi:MAG: aminotransferase class IV family protein [Candidatus Omnitrophica bacterium]|nr:aminotransferase class IV family protein [Candidatus Omnitrophota bacterium]
MKKSWFDDGAFETCRVEKGKILRLSEHMKRLRSSLKTLGIVDWDEKEVRTRLLREARDLSAGYVRVAVRREGRPRVLVHRREGLPYSTAQHRRGVRIRTAASRWPISETGLGQVKSSERLSSVLARMEVAAGAEVLRIGRHGFLTEGTVSNLFLVRQGVLTTPPGWLGVLEGVTRHRVLAAARRLKIPVQQVPVTRHDLFNAEEAFLTNVLMDVLPIREVDGRRIGSRVPGTMTRRLQKAVIHER